MQAFDAIAERRIREAQKRGEFDDLPGMGLPMALDDDTFVPEDLRVAYRLLAASEGTLTERIEGIAGMFPQRAEVQDIIAFAQEDSSRSLCLP